ANRLWLHGGLSDEGLELRVKVTRVLALAGDVSVVPALVELGNYDGAPQGLGRTLGNMRLFGGSKRYPYYEDARTALKELAEHAVPPYDPVALREQVPRTVHGAFKGVLEELAKRAELDPACR
ncbi:MAG TPA: hypothetical protein VGK73_00105, partial [Polyangiaceae bacterium]